MKDWLLLQTNWTQRERSPVTGLRKLSTWLFRTTIEIKPETRVSCFLCQFFFFNVPFHPYWKVRLGSVAFPRLTRQGGQAYVYLPHFLSKERPPKAVSTNFSCKRSDVNILGFASHMVSITTAHLYHCNTKATTDNMWTNEHGYVPIKLYLWSLKFQFCILLTCQEGLFDFFFLNCLKM